MQPLIMLCNRMKWTWTELMDQPNWFVTHMMGLIRAQADEELKASKK